MTKEELIQDYKLIMEFMGCNIDVTYKSDTLTMYSASGQFVKDLRNKRFPIGGIYDKMMLDNCRFNESWDWLMLVVKRIHEHPDCPSGIIIDDIHSRCYHEKGDMIFEGNTTLEALWNIILWSIRWLENKKLNNEKADGNTQSTL